MRCEKCRAGGDRRNLKCVCGRNVRKYGHYKFQHQSKKYILSLNFALKNAFRIAKYALKKFFFIKDVK